MLVALVGLSASVGAAGELARGQQDAAGQQLDRRANLVAEAVASETTRYVDTLRTVGAATGAFNELTASKFAQATAPLRQMQLAGATSIVFVVAATTAEAASTQALWRTRGVPDLALAPVGSAREHIYSIFNVTLDGSTPRQGIDVSRAPAPMQALIASRRTGQVAISPAYQLIIDQQLPPDQRQPSFVLTVPVYGAADGHGRRPFHGWVLMGLRGQDFIGATLARVSQNLLDVNLRTQNLDGTDVQVAEQRAAVDGRRDLFRRVDVTVADRRWRLLVQAPGRQLPGGISSMPTVVGWSGSALAVLLAWLVWVLATGRARARAQVEVAIAASTAAEADARGKAELLTAILDSISDGVGVVDADGAFLLHNPAAKALLGIEEDRDGPQNWQAHYGIYRPDGQTPFPVEELPLVRALAGESTEQVEMVIRNGGYPEGVVLTVSGRPLRAAAQSGAVAVFHDITARKDAEAALREREADLRAFAGVAAHDLRGPLAALAGYTELLAEDLARDVAPQALRPTVARMAAGIDRMIRLVNDLLTYATTRDGPLRCGPVDLHTLVEDVVAERTSHLKAAAGADGNGRAAPHPDIETGTLPIAHGDASMIRQLLDNLIGNSLKYTRPGQPASIDISAEPAGDGWTRVQVADRGIGIPPDEQPHVFTSFHRAAAHTGYAGSGLGLAICHRIIDRHGGSIAVADNPGGGTRIHFTLPTRPDRPGTPDYH